MQLDKSLQVCFLGDLGIGCGAFLRKYEGVLGFAETGRKTESVFLPSVVVNDEPYRVRFTDAGGSPCFDTVWNTLLNISHCVLLCYSIGKPETLENAENKWLPLFQSSGATAPLVVVGLQAHKRRSGGECVSEEDGADFASRIGATGFLEASDRAVDSQQVLDQVLAAAAGFYKLQWEEGPGESKSAVDLPTVDTTWLAHETLTVVDDPVALDEEAVRKSLSVLGLTPARNHAYLRADLDKRLLTSIDAIRSFQHLQFVNVSGNQLRSLEPLGALRNLLHLNASFNILVRTQSFTAPDQLETVDMSYNMITELGEWGVHKYLRELNLRGNFIERIGPGLRRNKELRNLDLSENNLIVLENLEGLDLRTLCLAQNKLTSLEGVTSLSKLQVLNVRHNGIRSVNGVHPDDIPRLRKLCISENQVSHICEVEALQNFPFLCDLYVEPNPIVHLPYYRAQVLHRLPRLRSLDAQQVTAEEKTKADVIYGADVETRKMIFEELLPNETFFDRRLVTEESILELEKEQFGQEGGFGGQDMGDPMAET